MATVLMRHPASGRVQLVNDTDVATWGGRGYVSITNDISTGGGSVRNLLGGRKMAATHTGRLMTSGSTPAGTQVITWMSAHTSTHGGYGIRALFGDLNDSSILTPYNLRASLVIGGVRLPVRFPGGKAQVTIDPNAPILCEPVPVTIAGAGVTYSFVCELSQDFGPTTTLAAGVSAGANSCSLTALPLITSGLIQVGTEAVYVQSITGSGPYTATLMPGHVFQATQSSGALVGRSLPVNMGIHSDVSGEGVASNAAYAVAGTIPAVGASSATTISGGATITAGSTLIPLTAAKLGQNFTLGAGGTLESVVCKELQQIGATYYLRLVNPTTIDHAAGEAVTPSLGFQSGYGPLGICYDRDITTPKPTVFACGDSKTFGTGDFFRNGQSWVEFGCWANGNPVINVAKAAETGATWATQAGRYLRTKMLTSADLGLYAYKTNDFTASIALSAAKADTIAALQEFHNAGLKAIACTIGPRATSSDAWTTVAGQTPSLTGGNLTNYADYNDWVRDTKCGGYADYVFDFAGVLESSKNSCKYKADAGGPYTHDGLHESHPGQVALGNALQALLATL